MTDLTPFGEEGFDPVSWVNAALADRGGEQGAERFLAEMEMRLQLAAEELEVSLAGASRAARLCGVLCAWGRREPLRMRAGRLGSLVTSHCRKANTYPPPAVPQAPKQPHHPHHHHRHTPETSATALRRVPFAQQEVSRLQSDSAALAAGVRSLLAATDGDAAAAAAAAAPLAAMHGVKTRMEAACATLREATELSGAFRQVPWLVVVVCRGGGGGRGSDYWQGGGSAAGCVAWCGHGASVAEAVGFVEVWGLLKGVESTLPQSASSQAATN